MCLKRVGIHRSIYGFTMFAHQVRGVQSNHRRPLDGEQTGLIFRLGAFPSTREEKWWTRLNGVLDFINKKHSFPKSKKCDE